MCFSDGATKNKSLPVVMFKYECDLENEVTVLVSDFRVKVNDAVESLKESYRCNNKCFFTARGPSFSKKNYARPRWGYQCFLNYVHLSLEINMSFLSQRSVSNYTKVLIQACWSLCFQRWLERRGIQRPQNLYYRWGLMRLCKLNYVSS